MHQELFMSNSKAVRYTVTEFGEMHLVFISKIFMPMWQKTWSKIPLQTSVLSCCLKDAEHLIHQEPSILTTSGSTCHPKMQITSQGKRGNLFMENYSHCEPNIWHTLARQCYFCETVMLQNTKLKTKKAEIISYPSHLVSNLNNCCFKLSCFYWWAHLGWNKFSFFWEECWARTQAHRIGSLWGVLCNLYLFISILLYEYAYVRLEVVPYLFSFFLASDSWKLLSVMVQMEFNNIGGFI